MMQRIYWFIRRCNYFLRHPVEFCFAAVVWLLWRIVRLAWMLLKKPPRLGVTVVAIAAWAQWGFWYLFPAAFATAVVFTLVWIALLSERGTARGFSAILTGVARLVRMRRLWEGACKRAGLAVDGQAAPTRGWRITQHGLSVNVAMGALGKAESEAAKYKERLKSTLYLDRVRIRPASPGWVTIYLEWGDHLRNMLSIQDIPASTREGYLAVGILENGEPLELPIGKSVLVAGLTGAGKSSLAWAVIYALIRSGIPFRVRIGDPKFIEWKIAKESIDESPIVYRYTDSPYQLGEGGLKKDGFMWEIDQDLTERLKSIPVGERLHTPTDDEPLELIIVDETLPMVKELKRHGASHPLARVTYMGRGAGEWVLFLSQTAEKDVLGPIRDLVPIGMAFATKTPEQTDMVLGSGSAARGAAAHLLDPTEDAGICYISTDEGVLSAGRIGFATDADTKFLIMGKLPPERTSTPDKYSFNRQCAVYVYYGPDVDTGEIEIKYVGNAYDPIKRYREHELREPEMMAEVTGDLTEVEWWPSKASAEYQEIVMIKKLNPKWNRQHNGEYYRGNAA